MHLQQCFHHPQNLLVLHLLNQVKNTSLSFCN